MAAPGVLDAVGFARGRVGSDEKEVGYQIKESSLRGLLGSLTLCFLAMAAMVVFMVYDIRLEKKSFRRDRRVQEHHAASKLAQVQMELWAQYQDDVHESREATRLLTALQTSYTEFKPQLQSAVDEVAKETGMNPDRAADFADRILHVVADLQNDNVGHAKKLVDHLVKDGKKGEKLERLAEEQLMAQVREEDSHISEDIAAGIDGEVEGGGVGAPEIETGGAGASEAADAAERDPLRAVLQEFWHAFEDHEDAFGGKTRESFENGSAKYERLAKLHSKIMTWKIFPPTDQDITRELDRIGLLSYCNAVQQVSLLSVREIVEELYMIPRIPTVDLVLLQADWKAGHLGSVPVLRRLLELRDESKVPSSWFQQGVDRAGEQVGAEAVGRAVVEAGGGRVQLARRPERVLHS